MSHMVPDWNLEDDSTPFHELLSTSNQKKSTGPYNELVELLWQDGHVVMHSQNHRKSPAAASQSKLVHRQELALKCGGTPGNSNNPIQEDDSAAWFRYPIDESLEKELFSDFFYEMPAATDTGNDRPIKDVTLEERFVKFDAAEESNVFLESASKHSNLTFQDNMVPLPKELSETVTKNSSLCFQGTSMPCSSSDNGGVVNFLHFARLGKVVPRSLHGSLGENFSRNGVPVEVGEPSSLRTIGSSMCGSNQVQNRAEASQALSDDITCVLAKRVKGDARLPNERATTDTYETGMTSSLGGSGTSFGRTRQQSTSNKGPKRKGRDGEESEYQSEDAEYESANKRGQRSASARRSRAAEVHNLSERKRRDRINEKMRALQELIPHCNKSDKASMLDEAIEYLKSLQLQVQFMWMGGGMAPMMYPGIQQYMSRMGMGMGHSPVQLPANSLVNQSISTALGANQTPMCTSPSLNPASFPNQMQAAHLNDSYAQYLGLHHIQPPPQAMNLYMYGSHMLQQNQLAVAASSSGFTTDAGVHSESINGRSDKRVTSNH